MLPESIQGCFSHEELDDKIEESYGIYHYRAFGLHIASDILLPELLTASDTSDMPEVNIRFGKIPTGITDAMEKTESCQVAKNQFFFRVPEVGCYYVTEGKCIVVEPAEHVEEQFVRLFLLGTAFGALLMQREIFPIHGSAVVIDGCCIIFTGQSGAGKSTLLASFREKGYPFLTDDVAAVTVDADGIARVHSAYPQQKLWRDSAEIIGIDIASLTPVYIGINKDKFSIPIHKEFWQSAVPLVSIYEIKAEVCPDVSIRQLSGIDKLAVLMKHTYRPWLIDGLDLRVAHFKSCTAIARQVAVSQLIRPEGVFSQEQQVRLVQQEFARLYADRAV